MTAYSLAGMTTLGTVTKEDQTKDAGLFQMPNPGEDSDQCILLDIFGASRTINISGVHISGDGSLTTAQFIDELDALVNGDQSATKSYISVKSGDTYQVLIMSISWNAEEGAVSKVDYSISMMQGTT